MRGCRASGSSAPTEVGICFRTGAAGLPRRSRRWRARASLLMDPCPAACRLVGRRARQAVASLTGTRVAGRSPRRSRRPDTPSRNPRRSTSRSPVADRERPVEDAAVGCDALRSSSDLLGLVHPQGPLVRVQDDVRVAALRPLDCPSRCPGGNYPATWRSAANLAFPCLSTISIAPHPHEAQIFREDRGGSIAHCLLAHARTR